MIRTADEELLQAGSFVGMSQQFSSSDRYMFQVFCFVFVFVLFLVFFFMFLPVERISE